ncbi:hypothetical protein C370_02448, partial [Cryptococcus neoformans A1-35-8]
MEQTSSENPRQVTTYEQVARAVLGREEADGKPVIPKKLLPCIEWMMEQVILPPYIDSIGKGFFTKQKKPMAAQWHTFGEILGPLVMLWLWVEESEKGLKSYMVFSDGSSGGLLRLASMPQQLEWLGVDGLVTHRTKAALKAHGQTVLMVKLANLHIIMIDLINDAMLEAHFLQNSTCNCPPFNNNQPATPHSPTLVIAQVQVMPQAPKGYMLQQFKWLDPTKHLPLGDTGKAARTFLGSINACFSCCKTGHHWLICPTCPPPPPL